MLREIFLQAWISLRRQPVRSCLTMAGIIWGIVAVTMLLAYGSEFRRVLMGTFDTFGHDIILCWPGTTSEQAGGERAGKEVKFEQADVDLIRADDSLVKGACLETVKFEDISYGDRLSNTAIR